MYTISDIKNRCDCHEISTFSVSFSPETINRSIMFDNIDDFFKFIKITNIKQIFLMESYAEIDDYLISDDVIDDIIGRAGVDYVVKSISSEIEKYNNNICKLHFDIPQFIFLICVYNGQTFLLCLENELTFNNEELRDPTEVLQEIYELNKYKIKEAKDKLKVAIEKQQEKLKYYILHDKDFYHQTNKHLRHKYTEDLFYNVLNSEFSELKSHWSTVTGIPSQGFHDFVDILWREYGKKNK